MVMPPPEDRRRDTGLVHGLLVERGDSSRIALVSPEHDLELSYSDLVRDGFALADRLERPSTGEGPRVALLLSASAEFAIALVAVSAAGGIAVPLDTYTKREELATILRFLEPALVITSPALKRRFEASLEAWTVYVLERDASGLQVAVLGAAGTSEAPAATPSAPPAPQPEDDAVFIMTSGSTGRPKAVRLSHRAIRQNVEMHLESLALEGEVISLQVTPVNFSYGLVAALLGVFRIGGTVVLSPYVIEPALIHRLVERYGVNLLMGTPTIFKYVLEKGGDDLRPLRSLRNLTLGGDRCRPDVAALICGRLPWTRAFITYGLTEAGPRVSTLPPERFESHSQSVGFALRGVATTIASPDGQPCRPGEVGELVLRTPSVMSGYFRDETKTAEKLRDGWLRTGDLARIDDSGLLYVTGRMDREFKYRGRRVDPSHIEQILFAHPGVDEARVTRVEDGQRELIVATIKARPGAQADLARELNTLCRKHLPAFLVPAEFRFFDPGVYLFKGKPGKQIAPVSEEG